MKTYIFEEPHPTGGNATVEITEEEIIAFCRKDPLYKDLSDTECVYNFVIINWAWEKEQPV